MTAIRELMSFDSFWTLWFWICHVAAWSLASHFTMGVPYDMVQEANREKTESGPWAQAAEAMILAQVFRFTTIARHYGTLLTGFTAFILAMIATLATLADLEFARALGTIMFPLALIYALTIRTAERIDRDAPRGRALRVRVRNQRLVNQFVGLLGITSAVGLALLEAIRDMNPWAF